jgi:2-polyprenyl-6-methoxyphenol hydroxylase-like FAD-dependent oxidoreductase
MVATDRRGWSRRVTVAGTDLLVVGAGTTGLALALQAHDHGARVRVVERRREQFRPSRALVVHPRTLEVLRPTGVTDALMAAGDPSPSVRLHLGRREVPAALGALPVTGTAFPHLLIEAQATVERILTEALTARGVEVERGSELVEVRPCGGATVATLRHCDHREEVPSRYVAGCDGPASAVRRSLGLDWRGGRYRQEVVLADLELDGDLHPGTVHAVAAQGGILFLFPLGEQATWRLLTTRPAGPPGGDAGQPDGPVPLDQLQALIDGARLPARVSDVAWSASVALEHRMASEYRAGPVFLLGDAAHVHSPAGGQGMNTGIQDAANLGWKLAFAAAASARTGSAPELLLASYEAERRPVARRVITLTHLIFWAEAGTGPVASLVRSRLVPATAPALPFLLRRRHLVAAGVRVLSQLGTGYRRSPLSMTGASAGPRGRRPGDRLPDELVVAGGHRAWLHDLLAEPGAHLLLERGAPPVPAIRYVKSYRIDGWTGSGVIGVRPDGYVGYRAATADPVRVGRWLELLGLSPSAAGQPGASR